MEEGWKNFACSFGLITCFICLKQPPMGDGDQGSNAEVPQPHEPECVWCGRPRQKRGHTGPVTQHQAAQHRVGSPVHG